MNAFGISKFIAPLINLIISVPVNFIMNKMWAFKTEKQVKVFGQYGNVLMVIDQDFSKSAILFDSYIYNSQYLTTRDLLFSIADKSGEVNLEKNRICTTSLSTAAPYDGLKDVDYILTDGCICFLDTDAEPILVDVVSHLYLYKMKDSKKFSPIVVSTE